MEGTVMSDLQEPEAPQSEPKEPEPQPSEVEQRIAAILGAQQELTQKVEKQESMADELRNLFAGLVQELRSIPRQPAAPAAPVAPVSPWQPPAGPQPSQTAPAANLQQEVQRLVQEALQPLRAESTAAAQKLDKHKQVFAKVVERYPALADLSTRDAQMFHQIYNSRQDLRMLDDAPILIAEMVRGLRSEERAAERDLDERKRQATIPASAGRKVPVRGDADVQKLKQSYDQLVAKGRTTPLSMREQGDLLNYTVALKHLNLI